MSRLPPQKDLNCKGGCCWRHLSSMLLQELHILRRFEEESREKVFEQKDIIAALAADTDREEIEELKEETQTLKLAFRALEVEHPTLVREIGVFRADYQEERQATDRLQAEVDALEEEKNKKIAKSNSLRASLDELEENISALSAQKGPLVTELGNAQMRNSTR